MTSRLKSVIEEALLADDRIKSVCDFQISRTDKNSLKLSFTAETIFGDIAAETEVKI